MKPLFPGVYAIALLTSSGCGPQPRPKPPLGVESPLEIGVVQPAADAGLPASEDAAPEVPPAPLEVVAVVGVVLPQEGPSARLGAQLAEVVGLVGTAGEDTPGGGVRFEVRSAADPDSVGAAFEDLAEAGVFGVVGLFDQSTAAAAVEAADAADLPTLMLTVSDAAVKGDGPTWRLLHTPLLVARTAAGAALRRGAKRAVIARPDTDFAEALATWFVRVWEASGGEVAGHVVWSEVEPDWAEVAGRVKPLAGDALFAPCPPLEGAQLLSHLAADGVWARRGERPRFRNDEAREMWVVGPPEWYTPALLRQAARYVDGALIPVPYAAETARGADFAAQLKASVGRDATAFDALLADAIDVLVAAQKRHLVGGEAPAEAVAGVNLATPRTSGLGFNRRDAMTGLIVLKATKAGFQPAD